MDRAMYNAKARTALTHCVDIYMGIHVSQLKDHTDDTRRSWEIGKDIYNICKPDVIDKESDKD
jgi:hypothetical protein